MANTISAETTADSTSGASVPDSVLEAAGRASRSWIVGGIWWIVLSAVVTAVLAYLAWRASDRQSELVIAAANVRISEAQRDSAEANKLAAEANERAKTLEKENLAMRGKVATLEERAANAETAQRRVEIELNAQKERAAEAERELLEIKARQAPRRFLTEERAVLVRFLSERPKGTITIGWAIDAESAAFAEQISGIVLEAGWSVVPEIGLLGGPSMFPGMTGVRILVRDPTNIPARAKVLQEAFALFELPAIPVASPGLADDVVVLNVGSKW